MKYAMSICLVVCFLALLNQAHAEVVFDTGTPADDTVLAYFESGKGYATEFSLSQPYSLTAIEAHMSGYRWGYNDVRWPQASGTATAVIYRDGGEIPEGHHWGHHWGHWGHHWGQSVIGVRAHLVISISIRDRLLHLSHWSLGSERI